MVKKHMKRCPNLLVVREIKMKYFTFIDLVTLKRAIRPIAGGDKDKVSLVHCGIEKLYSFFRRQHSNIY